MKIKSCLDYFYYTIGKQNYDFFLCGLKKVGEEIKSTKWKRFSEVVFEVDEFEDYKLNWVNQRQILIGYKVPKSPTLIRRIADGLGIDKIKLTQLFQKIGDSQNSVEREVDDYFESVLIKKGGENESN